MNRYQETLGVIKTRGRSTMVGVSLAILFGGARAALPTAPLGVEIHASAAGQPTEAPPSSAYVWMAGYWEGASGKWRWVAAHWNLPPTRSSVWVPGYWVRGGGVWTWVNGAWNLAERRMVPAGPAKGPGQLPGSEQLNASQTATQGRFPAPTS